MLELVPELPPSPTHDIIDCLEYLGSLRDFYDGPTGYVLPGILAHELFPDNPDASIPAFQSVIDYRNAVINRVIDPVGHEDRGFIKTRSEELDESLVPKCEAAVRDVLWAVVQSDKVPVYVYPEVFEAAITALGDIHKVHHYPYFAAKKFRGEMYEIFESFPQPEVQMRAMAAVKAISDLQFQAWARLANSFLTPFGFKVMPKDT